MLMHLHFAQPLWFFVGLAACVATLLFLRASARRRQQALQRFAAPHLLPRLTANVSGLRRRLKDTLVVLAVACVFIALARPQYGTRWVEVRRKGIDILIAVDTSRSMLARDIRPNRLERAKLAIRDFVGRLRGDRVGLLPFAGSAFLMCPLTTDYEAFNSSLDSLDTSIIPRGGTNIAEAIRKAEEVLANEANHKILVLVTDGENLQGDALAAAREAKKKKMTIYAVGVGTPAGELIPLPDGQDGFLQDSSGKFVTSRLDEKMLTRIAGTTGGLYVPMGSMGQGFDTIYQRKLGLVPKEEHGRRMHRVPVERFGWPVALALLLLTAEFLIPAGKPSWRLRLPLVRTAGRPSRRDAAATLLLALLLLSRQPAAARSSRGEEAYRSGHYDRAAAFYDRRLERSKDPVLLFNRGDVAYREKKYREAVTFFNQALASRDLDLQARAYYNRGNAQYRLGETALRTDPRQAMELWQEAIDSYTASLKLRADDDDARHNRNLVEKRLAELRKKQKRKEQNKEEQGKKKENRKNSGRQQDKGRENNSGNSGQNKKKEDSGEQTPAQGRKQQQQQSRQAGQQRRAADDDRQKKGTGSIKPHHSGNSRAGQQARAGAMQQRSMDRKRRAEGKMTREEAINLLNALKGEEGTLNFVPRSGTGQDSEPGRDW